MVHKNLIEGWKENWTYDDDDGWYYYNRTLAKDQTTEPLFNGVEVTNTELDETAKFDIYVYHESVIVGPGQATDGVVDLRVAQDAFE